MPRGKLHYEAYEEDGKLVEHWLDSHGGSHIKVSELDDQPLDDDSDESLNIYDAADIWASSGRDEDYSFGYSDDELENAL